MKTPEIIYFLKDGCNIRFTPERVKGIADYIESLEQERDQLKSENAILQRVAQIFHNAPEVDYTFTDSELAEHDAEVIERILPEKLSRDLAEPLCELFCTDECHRDCECNPVIQNLWATLRLKLRQKAQETEE